MKWKPVQILYFVDGSAPTSADLVAAAKLNAHVMYRNARAVPAEGSLEVCDGVAGKVPPRYAAAYPTAEKAIETRAEAINALSVKVGDSPAPAGPQEAAAPESAAPAPSGALPAATAADGAGDATVSADPTKEVAPGASPAPVSAWKAN